MSSGNYRYYCLDGLGNLHLAEWFNAKSDAEALALIEKMHPDGKWEVWQDERLVGRIPSKRLQA